MAENLFLKNPLDPSTQDAPSLDIPAIPRITTESRAPEVRQSSRVMRTTGLMPPQDLQPKFEAAAAEAGVPVNVLAALASQESNYNSEAVGQPTQWGRAKGMLQYIDPTAKSIGINPFDAEQSIKAAAKQLRQRLDNGDTMEEAVMAHFGGDDRAKWGPKTRAYGEEVLGKAGIIGKGLMDQQPAQAEPETPSYDLKSIQAELDAKESGRFKVLTAEEAAAMQAKGPAKAAVSAEADAGPDGFMSATGKALKNVPQNLKNSAGGLIRSIGEGIDDQSLVVQAKQAGILDQMQGTGDLVFKADSPEGKKRPYLKDGTFADTAVLADYIRKNAASLLPSDEAAANMTGMQPGSVSQYGSDLSADARKSMVQVNPDGPLAKYGSMIIGSTAEMLPALTASVLARSPQPMMAIMGGQVFGQSYDKAREKGMNAQEAGGYATAQAVAEAIPEALPLHFILKPGQQFFKGLLTAGAAESLQEGVTQAIQSGIDKGTLDPNMTWGEAVEQIRDAMIVGAGSGALMRGGVHGVQKLTNRDAAPAADPSADPTAPVDQAAPQDRVEPTISEQQAPNTAQEAPNTTAPAPNIAPTPAAPTGPLTRAAAQMDPAELAKLQQGVVDAAAQEQAGTEPAAKPAGEPVTVRGSDGEMPGTLESYQEDGKGGWTARVLADDGNAYDFTQDDGVTLDRPAAAGTSPAAQPVAEPSPAQMDEPVAQPEETSPPPARQIKDMSVPELRAELKEVAAGIREDRTDASLKARRKDIEKAINAAVEGAIKDPSTAARHVERATNLPKPDAKKASPEELAAADIENSRGRDELAKRAEEYRKWKTDDDARKGAEKAAVDAVAGEKINGRWSRFSPDTGTLGVPRADMPQIKAEHRGAMTQFLNARGIEHRQEEVPARDLKPTQEEFSPAKVKQAIGFTGGDRAILVSSDGHILDGHHQWLAKYAENQPVKIIRLDAPIKQLLETVREFPSAGQSNGSTVADVKQTAADVKETVDPVKETPTYDEKIQRGYASVQRYAREMADKAKANKGDAKAQNDAKVAARDVENYTKRHAKTLGLDGAGKSAPDTARAAELNKQAAEAYSRGHAITHDENGLRTHENSPSPQEKLEAEEHFTESARLNIEEKRALGEEPGAIQLANYDRRVRDLETRREQVKNLASKPAETASVPAKTASKPAEPASDQPKPAFKTPKQKALERKVQLQRKARETIGAEEGEQITLSDDVGYATGGRTYTVESINTDGSVTISSERGKTDLSRAELQGAINRGVTISRVEKPAAKAKPEVSQNTLVSDQADASKTPANSVSMMARLFGNGAQRIAIQKKGLQSFDVDVQRRVLSKVVDGIHDDKVFDAVVDLVPVDVMHVLTGKDLTADGFRHDRSVLRAALTVPLDGSISRAAAEFVNSIASARQSVARPSTVGGASDSVDVGVAAERDSALGTNIGLQGGSSEGVSQTIPLKMKDVAPSANTVFTEDAASKARALLKSKLGQLNSGIDPEILQAGITLAGYHIEKGARSFAAYARAMTEDLGGVVKPYLKSWYMGVKYDPRASGFDGMSAASEVEAYDVNSNEALQDGATPTQQPATAQQPAEPVAASREEPTLEPGVYTHDRHPEVTATVAKTEKGYSIEWAPDDVQEFKGVNAKTKAVAALTREGYMKADEAKNAPSSRSGVEQDRQDAGSAKPVDADSVRDAAGQNDGSTRDAGASARAERDAGQRDSRLPDDGATAGGTRGDKLVHQPDGQFRPESGNTRGSERTGSGRDSEPGAAVEQERADAVIESAPAADARDIAQRVEEQRKASKVKTKRGDKANIDEALPLLLPPQREDVLKAEIRHAIGNGMLFTNGTGTGKTASGLGVAKRFIGEGKDNIIIVVPSDKIASDWVKFAGMMDINLKALTGTTDNGGAGPVITTYANFGANETLAQRNWDLAITDESHYLSSNEAGQSTGALEQLRALTGHHDGFYKHVREANPAQWKPYLEAMNASRDAAKDSSIIESQRTALAEAEAKAKKVWDAVEQPARKAWDERWSKQEGLPKTVFLSATPFPYVKNVDYAEGYLFNYVDPADMKKVNNRGDAYNSGDAREKFFMQHFGYRMRYNKLTAPEAGVDSELMEQNFNQWLKDAGSLSGRRLEVEHDYDRKFATVDDAVGQKIDEGLKFLREEGDGKYREAFDAVSKQFDYHRRQYLLESIKARAAVPVIKEHLALGRKVVLFHDFNKGGGFDPFDLNSVIDEKAKAQAREAFAARPDLFRLDLKGLNSPIVTLKAAFPDALFFNGTVPKRLRRENADAFNDDNGDKHLIVVQSDAGREGVSLHDTSGKHQRVLINLGMPGKPVAAIQIEGRTYRTGQASDAIFRYLTTGTAWEASAFATKIAERASTAENLALGTDARGLKQSFIDAYNSADEAPASREDGKGGKAYDRSMAAGAQLSGFQKAKTYYFAQQKNTRRRDQREGTDYFATPEPLGFKMAEWANINQGDKVLEPSAGHGAIARFFPPRTDVTMVEPSYELSQRAALANGAARIVNDRFEDLHLTNKYDAVVMNPPYGSGGKTAIEHVAKAVQHLRDGGRVVALIPRGNLADKRLETFLASPEAADMHIVADIQMPASTFERAGTAVNTHVIILEKHANPADAEGIQQRNIDLSNAQNVGELFDRIEDLGLPERQPSSKPEPKEEIIEHVTGGGKVLRGVVRQGLTKDEAKEIDPFTFKKNGGYFIRAKHLDEAKQSIAAAPDLAPQSGQADRIRDTLLASPLGKSITRLMGEGRIVLHNDSQTLPATSYPGTQALTMPDGTVHLVADSLTPSSAVPVLLHEMFHSGGESLVGSKRWGELQGRLSSLYSQFEKSPGKAGEFFQAARQRVQDADAAGNKMGDALTTEEFGAYAIEQYARAPETVRKWVDGVTGAVKEFMFRRFGIQLGQVSPAQLRAMAVQALDQQASAPTADARYSVKPSEHFTDLNADQKTFLDKIGPERLPQKLKDRWSQLTNNLALRVRQAGVDRYAALLRNDKLLHGEDTLEGSIASSSWVLARMSPSAGGAVSALLNNGRIYLDTKEKVIDIKEGTEGLGATLRKLGSPQEIDRFMGWIAANRSKRLLAEGRENLFTAEEIEAGIKLSGGKLESGKSRSLLYAQAWKDFQQHRDDVLGIAESTGIITPEQRETWSEEFYVPFYRVTDEDSMGGPSSGSGLSRQQAYKKLKGGKQHLNDLLDNTLLNFHHLLQASLKNQAAAQAMENAKQLGIAQETTESKRDKKMSTFVMVDGEKQWYDVGDALTFKAVSALADAGLNNPAMKVGRAFKRFFTNMTTITPQFVVANAIRDTLAAMATSPTSFVPLKTAFKGALTYGNDTAKARMMASGGAFSFGHVYGQNATELKASLTQSMRGAKVLSDPKLIPGALLTAWRKYHAVTDFAENMNRAGIWEHNQGRGKLKAAFEARDLMDFSAHGDAAIIRIMTDLVPFMNARIQGLDKLYRSGAKPAIKTLFGKGSASDKQSFGRFVAVVGALTAMSALLYLRNKDDEDYRKLEDWQRDTYWPIKIGDSMFFIPKPFEVGSIATMGERLLEQFVDPTVGGEKLASRAAHMLGDTFAFNPIPQVVKPLYELGANENTFTGRPIEDQSMQKLSPSLRSRPETSRLADVTSRGLEAALDAVGGKNAALSPVQIDHLIQGYTGAVGATAVGMADTIWRRASGEELPARRWSEYQPIKRFYKDLTQEDNYTRYGTDFYSALKKVDQDYADFQHLVKFGQDERALELSNDKGDELALRGSLVKVSRSMSKINMEMKRVQMDKDMSGEGKRLELDRLRGMRNLITEEVGKQLEQDKMAKRASGGQ